ncbi:DUF2306 domain-containing protein [Maricaulis sp. D1M11]|uniref:DUF2306 domain-containing protein n=1 Tax=Maricaulis sp. D1M11 TaxID=3076117 RepID=UPI0039B4BB1A
MENFWALDSWIHSANGAVHMGMALLALLLGPLLFLIRKGNRFHRIGGYLYVLAMLTVNITALTSYDLSGRPNIFHFFALMSLAGVIPGYFAIRAAMRRPNRNAVLGHAKAMSYSYMGLFAAGLSQIGTRLAPSLFLSPIWLYVFLGSVVFIGFLITAWMVKATEEGLGRRYSPAAR